MCLNGNLLLKDKDYDRVFVGNDPVNLVDPEGLEYSRLNTTPYDTDYGGGSGGFAPPPAVLDDFGCLLSCLFDKGLMSLPGLSYLPYDLNFTQKPLGYDKSGTSGGLSDATASATRVNKTAWGTASAIAGEAKGIAQGAGLLGLAAEAWDLKDDVAECECKCKKEL